MSWFFSSEEPFSEFLFSFDPDRNLNFRSILVLLIFVFGLIASKLMYRLEELNRREKRLTYYLEGSRAIHRILSKVNQEAGLVEQVQLELKAVFGLKDIQFTLFPARPIEQGIPEVIQSKLQEQLACRLQGTQWDELTLRAHLQGDCMCGVIRFQEQLLGVYSVRSEVLSSEEKDVRLQTALENIMADFAQALSRIRSHDRLEQQAAQLQALYANAPVGIFSSTVQGKLLFLNQTMAGYLEATSPAEVMSQIETVHPLYPDPESRDQYIQSLKRTRDVTRINNPMRGLDGKLRHLVFFSRLTGRGEKEHEVIEGFVIDETGTLEMARRNRNLEETLVKARHYESVAGLAAGVTHEFNNILQAIMGSAYLVQLGMEKDTPGWKYLQDIQDSGGRAGRLCDQMLTYAGKKAVMMREEQMDDVTSAFRVMFKSDLPSGILFRMNLEGGVARARVDRTAFSEAVRTLVVNAGEAIGPHGGEVTLYSCTEPLSEGLCARYGLAGEESNEMHWTLRVRDTGPGMEPETLRRIFDPFFTTKFQGRGLGLAAAKGAIEKLDGKLGVSSRVGLGTEFLLALPVSLSVEIVEEAPQETQTVPVLHAGGTVWIVDDEPLICETMSRFIITWGLDCEVSTDSVEAVERMKKNPDDISCILLDVTMPGMDGLEVLGHVRLFRPDVPVVLMSGFSEEETLRKFKGHDISGFIHKPFQATVLEGHLRRVLGETSSSE